MNRRHKIMVLVGTRPNFMKTAPVMAEMQRRSDRFDSLLVHTGQHYDQAMSQLFFDQLGIGEPDFSLSVGSGSHARQTARVMERLEPVLLEQDPDLLLVPGDVNSTIAGALVAAKLGVRVAHIEAGLRSFDRTMPEEHNRVLTDQLADLLFTHSPEAEGHLLREGRPKEAVHYVGNTMIDTLIAMRSRIDEMGTADGFGLSAGDYVVVTLHRPALVDSAILVEAMAHLDALSHQIPVIFPCHPRTRKAIAAIGAEPATDRLRVVEPLGYLEFLSLVSTAGAILTDSGGIQEETTFLGVPCFTLRDNTERPVTVDIGTNRLLGLDPKGISRIPELLNEGRESAIPPLWDGHASSRIVDVLQGAASNSAAQA